MYPEKPSAFIRRSQESAPNDTPQLSVDEGETRIEAEAPRVSEAGYRTLLKSMVERAMREGNDHTEHGESH